jgi:pyruvate/2-oxoglutarate dehydrogenase complex dihydrolipoamide acyltransferase (E2) component
MARFGEINAQYFDDAGDPLGSGKLYFYESGTTTPKITYADINFTIPNTNPVILTAAGRQPNIFFDGVAKAILADKNDVQILVRDPVGETGTNFGDPWVATRIYSTNSVVIGSDGVYYRSLVAGNQNNNPINTSGFWSLLYSIQWNAGITYQEGSIVTYDGEQYQSLTNSNVNNNPSVSVANWVLLSFAWISTAEYALNQNAVGTDGVLYTSQQAANTGNDPADPANRPTYWVGTSADAAASAAAAAASASASASSATDSANSATASAASAVDSSGFATNSQNSATASANSAAASQNSATASANSATASANSATQSASSATNSANSAIASAASAAGAVDTLEEFEDIYLGEKASDPTVDNQGQALQTGALYFNTTTNILRIYNGTAWQNSADIVTSLTWSQITDAPDYNGQATKYLKSTGAAMSWETVPDEIPDQSGQNGNVLTTNGSVLIWSPPSPDELPLQVGNAGKYLTTDGSTPSWATVESFSEPKAYFFSGF